ncbi:photosystem I assembly protein Ycf3 [Phycisphaerae bacterium RAS1]|nr:photosystem I assembly protein Ycf3 [Phycisphaerae bacterium RAS1]
MNALTSCVYGSLVASVFLGIVPATQAQTQSAPATSQAAEERFMSDEEFLKIGVDFDLDAYIKGLNPPTVEEIVKSRQPIPTLKHILDSTERSGRRLDRAESKHSVEATIGALLDEGEGLLRKATAGNQEAASSEQLENVIAKAERVLNSLSNDGQSHTNRAITQAKELLVTAHRLRELPLHQRRLWGEADRRKVDLDQLTSQADFARALGTHRSQVTIYETLFGSDYHYTAVALSNCGDVLYLIGDLSSAERLYRTALAIVMRLHATDHPRVVASLNNCGAVLHALGDFANADNLCRDALAMHYRVGSAVASDVAPILNNVGTMYADRGEFAEAEMLLRKALSLKQQSSSEDKLDVALTMGNLAGVLHQRGDADHAETMFRDSLAIAEKFGGSDSFNNASSLSGLAQLGHDRGDLVRAEVLDREALAMCRRLAPGDHPEVAAKIGNLASVLDDRGNFSEAEAFCREALAMRTRLYVRDHPEVALTLANLAMILLEDGNCEEAVRCQRDALSMWKGLFASDHHDTANSLGNLASIYLECGSLEDAETCARDALAMSRRLYAQEHSRVALRMNNLAVVLRARGKLDEAESLFRDGLAMWQQLFIGDHPRVADALNNMASVLLDRGFADAAEPFARQAFEMIERLRPQIVGGERERAEFAQRLKLRGRAHAYAVLLTRIHRESQAIAVLEQGRARAALDALVRSDADATTGSRMLSGDVRTRRAGQARQVEQSARIALSDSEALLVGRRKERMAWAKFTDRPEPERNRRLAALDEEIAALSDAVKQKRQALTRAGSEVLVELRGLFPIAQPRSTEEILKGLAPTEAVVSFSWGDDSVLVAVAGGGQTTTAIVAENKEQTNKLTQIAANLRAALSSPGTAGSSDGAAAHELLSVLLPDSIRRYLSVPEHVLIVPDGPLSGIPFEALVVLDPQSPLAGKPIVYAPSVTVYLNRMELRRGDQAISGAVTTASPPAAVVLGAPVFDRDYKDPEYPTDGVLLAKVVANGNAAKAGFRRGDVLLRYGDQKLDDSTPIQKAMAAVTDSVQKGERPADAPVKIAYWRNGREAQADVPLGKLGVQPQEGNPADGLRSMALMDTVTRGGGEFEAGVSATDQVRLYGGVLPPLPGTHREAKSIAALVGAAGGKSALLTGADASIPKLWDAVTANPPKYLHLATHGLMGSADRPMDASLALTQPEKPTPDDVGFLRLDDLIGRWGGKLKGCELVVLSACDTQRGIQKGDSSFSLPLGFMFAGAKTVVASLWKVDDAATQLLMTRFYENLLGKFDAPRSVDGEAYAAGKPLPKLAALREAQAWLRSLSWEDARRRTEMTEEQFQSYTASRGIGQPTTAPRGELKQDAPFAHPYYWAAFIMIGDPE